MMTRRHSRYGSLQSLFSNSYGRAELGVTVARRVLDAPAVDDRNAAARIIDELLIAQFLRDTCDARAIDAEDAGDLLVRQVERRLAAPVLDHQEPRAEPLLDRVIHVADRFLRDLPNIDVEKVAQPVAQLLVGTQHFLECLGVDALGRA